MTDTATVSFAPDSGVVDPTSPWPGLAAFEEHQAGLFFGRNDEIDEVLRAISSARLTVVFGKSGLGKSSLLRAGVFPRLREQSMLPVYMRGDFGSGAMPISSQMRAALVQQAADSAVQISTWREQVTAWEYLHDASAELWSLRHKLLTPVFVFDQVEELFTRGTSEAARRFLSELADLVEGRVPAALKERIEVDLSLASHFRFNEHRYRILFSLREDYLADLEGQRRDMPSLASNRVRIGPMNGEQALQAVLGPGAAIVSESVAHRIVTTLAGNAARHERELARLEVEPTLLSLLCRELNNRRLFFNQSQITLEAGDVIGDNVLSDFYSRCVRDISPAFRIVVEERLLTASGLRDTEPLENALKLGVRADEIERLIARRLIRVGAWSGAQRMELVHDVLTGVVKRSRDIRIAVQAAAAVASDQAERLRQSKVEVDRRRERLLRRMGWAFAGALSLVCLLEFGLVYLAYRRESTRLEREKNRAATRGALGSYEQIRADMESLREEQRHLAFRSLVRDDANGILQLSALLHHDRDDAVSRAALLNALVWSNWSGRPTPVAQPMRLEGCGAAGRPQVVRWSASGEIVAWYDGDGSVCSWQSGSTQGHRLRAVPSEVPADIDADSLVALVRRAAKYSVVSLRAKPPMPDVELKGDFVLAAMGPGGVPILVTRSGVLLGWSAPRSGSSAAPVSFFDDVRAVASLGDHLALLHASRERRTISLVDLRPQRSDDDFFEWRCADLIEGSTAADLVFTAERPAVGDSCGRRASLWDAKSTKAPKAELLGASGTITHARFSHSGSRIAAAMADGAFGVWDATTGLPIILDLEDGSEVLSLDFSPGGERVVASSADGRVDVLDVPDGTPDGAEDVPAIAEAMVGRRILPGGMTEIQPETQRQNVLREQRRKIADAPPLGPSTASILRWVLADADQIAARSPSPFAPGSGGWGASGNGKGAERRDSSIHIVADYRQISDAPPPVGDYQIRLDVTATFATKIERVDYFFPHPDFIAKHTTSSDSAAGFATAYRGHGCIDNITVAVAFKDGSSESIPFDQCSALGK